MISSFSGELSTQLYKWNKRGGNCSGVDVACMNDSDNLIDVTSIGFHYTLQDEERLRKKGSAFERKII